MLSSIAPAVLFGRKWKVGVRNGVRKRRHPHTPRPSLRSARYARFRFVRTSGCGDGAMLVLSMSSQIHSLSSQKLVCNNNPLLCFGFRCPLSLFPLRINIVRLSVYAYHELLVMWQADHNCLPKIPAVGSFIGY